MQEQITRLLNEISDSRMRERREQRRHPFTRPVMIHKPDEGPQLAFSKDLSLQGIGLVHCVEWPEGSLAVLEIHSLEGAPVCVRSEVRWCRPYGPNWYLIGWRFIAATHLPIAAQ